MERPDLELVTGTFKDCEVVLDGKHLKDVMLENVTLLYNGHNCGLTNVTIKGNIQLVSNIPGIANFMELLKVLEARKAAPPQPQPRQGGSAFMSVGPLCKDLSVHIDGGSIRGFPNFILSEAPVEVHLNKATIEGPLVPRGDKMRAHLNKNKKRKRR